MRAAQQIVHACRAPLLLLQLILLLPSSSAAGRNRWLSSWSGSTQDGGCHAGCSGLGNCNLDLGLCECPYGFAGERCELPVLGACRSSDSPLALVMQGNRWPKSCECLSQRLRYFSQVGSHELEAVKHFNQDGHPYCYERVGVPPERQFSDVPLANASSGVTWLKPITVVGGRFPELPPPLRPSELFKDGMLRTFDEQIPIIPLDSCSGRCSDRGACLLLVDSQAAVAFAASHLRLGPQGAQPPGPTCACRKGFTGPSCADPQPELPSRSPHVPRASCPGACSGKGECWAGFCKCAAGRWGADCSRQRSFPRPPQGALLPYPRVASKLRIYRYELPWTVVFRGETEDGRDVLDPMYAAELSFSELLAVDWAVRTENPWEANLFFVPLLRRSAIATIVNQHVKAAMLYIRESYPELWQRHNGRDHFMFLPEDLGACGLRDDPLVQAPIKLVHFGMQVPSAQYHGIPGGGGPQGLKHVPALYSCYHSAKDIVVPDHDVYMNPPEIKDSAALFEVALDPASEPRPHLLYFHGSWRLEEKSYSGGARQAYHDSVHLLNDSRVRFGGRNDQYRASTFCFCPYGDGWGNRLSHIVLAACIPVIVQDHAHMALDEVLPYEEMAVRLRVRDVPHMLAILEAISQEQIFAYRRSLQRYRLAFYWTHPAGLDPDLPAGQAYNYTLLSLAHKLPLLWGNLSLVS